MMDNKVKYAHYQLRQIKLSLTAKNTNLESVAINEAVNVPPQEIHINERLQPFFPNNST